MSRQELCNARDRVRRIAVEGADAQSAYFAIATVRARRAKNAEAGFGEGEIQGGRIAGAILGSKAAVPRSLARIQSRASKAHAAPVGRRGKLEVTRKVGELFDLGGQDGGFREMVVAAAR